MSFSSGKCQLYHSLMRITNVFRSLSIYSITSIHFPHLVQDADGLDDHVVLAVHVELHVGARVAVAQTQHGLLGRTSVQRRHELAVVLANAAGHLQHDVARHAGNVQLLLDGLADASINLQRESEKTVDLPHRAPQGYLSASWRKGGSPPGTASASCSKRPRRCRCSSPAHPRHFQKAMDETST